MSTPVQGCEQQSETAERSEAVAVTAVESAAMCCYPQAPTVDGGSRCETSLAEGLGEAARQYRLGSHWKY